MLITLAWLAPAVARADPPPALLAAPPPQASPAAPSFTSHAMKEVASGIYLFRTAPYGDVGLDGNSIAIISHDGVLVFDANGTPSAARAVLAEIRKLTRQPVRYLVYSHWHWDHWYGAQVYADSFPGLVIVAHEQARELMAGPAIAFNAPGLDTQLPAHIQEIEDSLAAARAAKRPASEIAKWAEHAERDRWFLAEKRGARHVLPTRTFTDSLILHLGEREIHVLHVDRAITPGDAFLYLPKENLVVSGDLLVNPVTFALFCYPAGWIRTLQWIDALDAATLIPGHGAALENENLLHATLALLERERALAREMKARGLTVEQAEQAILADAEVQRLRASITGGDLAQDRAFPYYLVNWFVPRAFAEAAGALPDSIPSHP